MPENETPATQGSDSGTPPAPVPPAGGQPENWEERFKGLQRKYNTLEATVSAKDSALGTVKSEFDVFKTTQAEALTRAQLDLADRDNKLKAAETEKNTHQTRAQALEAQLNQANVRKEQRSKLITAQGVDLVEAFEAGHLNLDGVADDAIGAKLADFRSLAAKIAGAQYSGTTPASPAVSPSANPTGLNFEQLYDWVENPANYGKPEYETMHEAYLSLIPK